MFDPYREWLGVTEERRPPTLYQLLRIAPSETNPSFIEAAAARQLARLQGHITGPKAKEAWRLIDEVTLAKATLLDPARRSAYDTVYGTAPKPARPAPAPQPPANAWGQPVTAAPAWQPAAPAPEPTPSLELLDDEDEPSSDGLPTPAPMPRPRRKQGASTPLLVGGAILLLGLVGGGIYLATRGDKAGGGDSKQQEVAETGDNRSPTLPPSKNKGADKGPKPKGVPAKKRVTPKATPKNDPPPPESIADEFKEARLFRGHDGTPRALAVSPDGKQLLTAGDDLAVFAWTPDSDRPRRRMTLKSPAVGVAFLPGGKEGVVADGGAFRILDLATNAVRKELPSPAGGIQAIAAGGARHVLTASTDGYLRWWDVTKDAPEHAIDASMQPLDCVALAPDGKTAVAGTRNGDVVLANLVNGSVMRKLTAAHPGGVAAVAFDPDGKRLVSAGVDRLAKVWDVGTGTLLATLKGHDDVPMAAAFTADGAVVLTGGADMTVRAWDPVTGAALRWWHKAEAKVASLALDPKDRFLIAGLGDGGLQMLFLPQVRPDSPARGAQVPPPAAPLPPPPATSVESALKSVREKYGKDFARTAAEEKLALFDKLFTQARLAPVDAATRFALFQEARDLAAAAGQVADALKASEARSKWFDADELADKAAALKVAAQGAVGKAVVESALSVVEDAERQARPDIVDELFRRRELFPQSADTPDLNARIQAAEKRWESTAAERESSRRLAADFRKDPENPATNLAYGKHLGFRVGEWADGLPKLAKGDDPALKDLARKDLANPKDPRGQVEVAKAWFDYAAKAEAVHRPGILLRAKHWYDRAVAGELPPQEKLSAGQRLSEINKQVGMSAATLARPGEPVVRHGFNTIRTATAVETQWVLVGSDGFTPEGVVLKNDASTTSRFKVLDKARVEFFFVPDGREVKVQLNGEEAVFKPAAGASPVSLSVERAGNALKFALKSFTGTVEVEKSATLAGAKQEPTPVTFGVSGPAEKDGLRMTAVVVSGPVKPTE